MSLRLRMSFVASFVAALGVAALATVGLAAMEQRMIADRLDASTAAAGEWLSTPIALFGSDDAILAEDFGLDLLAAQFAAQPPQPDSAFELVLAELGLGTDDPIPVALDSEFAALLSGGDATIVALDTVSGTLIDAGILYGINEPIPGLRSRVLTRRDLVVARIPFEDKVVVTGAFVDDIRDLADTMSRWAAVWAPAVVAGVFAMAWVLTGRALHPVGTMTGRVATITPEAARQGERVPVPGSGDELARLAERFNNLIDQIVEGDLRQRRFTADAGHELRSPLAVIRSETEQALTPGSSIGRDELAETVLAETLRLQELVDDLLVLARTDETAPTARRFPVDVDDLILTEARRQRRLPIDISQLGAGRTVGDPDLLARAFRHLIDNAVRHSHDRVAVSVGTENDLVMVRVDDDGTGIPESDRHRIFERFVRLDEGRSRDSGGAGLGLAVTADIIRAHGGDVTVEDSPHGGARFVVRLPAAEPED
jgi:signal transduction histidine kinase